MFAFVIQRGQFQILDLEKFHSPLCTDGWEKVVFITKILATFHAWRLPVRFFWERRCSFAVIYLLRTLFVTLYIAEKTLDGYRKRAVPNTVEKKSIILFGMVSIVDIYNVFVLVTSLLLKNRPLIRFQSLLFMRWPMGWPLDPFTLCVLFVHRCVLFLRSYRNMSYTSKKPGVFLLICLSWHE